MDQVFLFLFLYYVASNQIPKFLSIDGVCVVFIVVVIKIFYHLIIPSFSIFVNRFSTKKDAFFAFSSPSFVAIIMVFFILTEAATK